MQNLFTADYPFRADNYNSATIDKKPVSRQQNSMKPMKIADCVGKN